LNALLPLTEAAELSGLATIARGDITRTPPGDTVADAGMPARQASVAPRMRRGPLVTGLLAMRQAAAPHRLAQDLLTTALARDSPAAEAARQVAVARNWGRAAERLASHDRTARLALDHPAGVELPQS
jgi:hypothetical protein